MASFQQIGSDATDIERTAMAALVLATQMLNHLKGGTPISDVAATRIFEAAFQMSQPKPGTAARHLLGQFVSPEFRVEQFDAPGKG